MVQCGGNIGQKAKSVVQCGVMWGQFVAVWGSVGKCEEVWGSVGQIGQC